MTAPPPAAPRRVSFVVPAFDEEQRLSGSLRLLIDFCTLQAYESEIIVVDDGSSDRTADVAREAAGAIGRVSLSVLSREHRGKGAAVQAGALAAGGDYVLYLDADMATPPEETPKLLAGLAAGSDVAIGVRIQPGGHDLRISQPGWRRIGGRLFGVARRRLILSNVDDTQCGFKAFRRDAAQALFSRQRLEGWAFDAELLFMAQRLGFSIRQVPVEWKHVEGSRFQLTAASALRELRDLLRIRWLHRGLRRPAGEKR